MESKTLFQSSNLKKGLKIKTCRIEEVEPSFTSLMSSIRSLYNELSIKSLKSKILSGLSP